MMAKVKRGRKQQSKPVERSSWVTPASIVAVTICVLIGYVVVKRSDEISEVKVAGTGIAFRGSSSPRALPPDEQRQRSQRIEAKIEEDVREAAPPEPPPPTAVDLTGTWTLLDGTATWTVTVENGYLVFREQNAAAPGVVSAIGYGSFDGNTWSLQVQTIVGTTGTATLEIQADGSLRGEADIAGTRFLLALRR
jgi:hypothetical protein